MKKMVLTGLAQDTDFEDPEASSFFLVFNGGELRVPISEKAAQVVVEYQYQNNEAPSNGKSHPIPTHHQEELDPNDVVDDEGVDQV
jgi:hypothetical protein